MAYILSFFSAFSPVQMKKMDYYKDLWIQWQGMYAMIEKQIGFPKKESCGQGKSEIIIFHIFNL